MDVLDAAREHRDYMIRVRRHLHAHPELSLEEVATADFIAAELTAMEIPHVRVGRCGVVATVAGRSNSRMVALRADIDALPIQEENPDLDYASRVPGVMHACGHDGHTAMLLGAARILKARAEQMPGTVKLCFQQAEEIGRGAAEIMEELAPYPVESMFGIHLWSELETGRISIEPGPRMAAVNRVVIRVRGVGAHGAYPNRGADPIIAAAAIVMNCAALNSREIDPAAPVTLSFGQIAGGSSANVIPEEVTLTGTLRTTSRAVRAQMVAAIERVARTTAETWRTTAEVEIGTNFGLVDNHPDCSALAHTAVARLGLEGSLAQFPTLMASENFAEYLERYPGLFAFIGVRNPEIGAVYPHHNPKFRIDEDSLVLGAALHAQYALESFAAPPVAATV
ncbi:MAG: amidohydrolase [Alkalilacustris sp.]